MGELDGTTAAVWGDANGVAAATKSALEEAGARVVSGSEEEDVGAFLEAAAAQLAQLDLAVICVGGPSTTQPLVEISDEQWQRELDQHLGVAFRGIRASLARMLPQGSGSILVTTSVESKVGRSGVTPYVAAQHGIGGLVKSTAREIGPQGLLINALICGVMDEAGDDTEAELLGRGAIKRPNTPEEVAAAAVLLASPGMSSITGTLFPIHGGVVPY